MNVNPRHTPDFYINSQYIMSNACLCSEGLCISLCVVTEGLTDLLVALQYSLDPQMLLLQSLGPGARRQLTHKNITMQDSAPWLCAQGPPLSLCC